MERAPNQHAQPDMPARVARNALPCILTVDDDATTRAMLVMTIRKAGYHAIQAESGKSALALIENKHPDLAILDIQMPSMSGIELAQHLKDGTDIPFIFLSSATDDALMRQAEACGALDFLVKPADPARIISAIRTALEHLDCAARS